VLANLAVVTLRFERSGRTPSAAGRNLALKTDSLRRALAALGVPRDSVINGSRWYWWRERMQLVESIRNDNVYRTDERGNRVVTGVVSHLDTTYRARENLQVRIRDLARVGAVIDAALAEGIVDIGDVAFSATETESAQRQAILEATRMVRARAETIAAAGGGHLGRTLRLSTEGGGGPSRYAPFDYLSLQSVVTTGSADEPGATVVVAPAVRVSATVNGRWELIPGP
jgi:hypothetical protein